VANTIQTNTLTTVTKNSYTYLAQPTTPNAPEYLPGDGTLVVPDFDSYVMFDFSQRMPDGSLMETDLSGAGQIYLTFIDDQRQVKIHALQSMANVDKTIGQAVFRITADQSASIFQLSNRYYFVTTAVSVGAAVVNETVLYAGVWLKSNEPERVTYSERLRLLNLNLKTSDTQLMTLQAIVDELRLRKINLTERSTQLDAIINDLKNQIGSTSEEIANIEAKIEKDKEAQAVVAEAAAEAADAQKKAEEEQIAKKSKRRKAKIVENKQKLTFLQKLSGAFKNPLSVLAFVLNPIGGLLSAGISKGYKVSYTLELEDTKEKVKVKRFAYIYSDTASVNNAAGNNTFIDDTWFTIKDSEGARPAAGKVTVVALIDKRLDQFDAKDQFKTMIGTDPIKEPPVDYNNTNKSAAAFYLGGNDNYYYKYVTYARDVDPQKKITELIGEVEL
jgi:regulator of protease activity HflC (stomatin/prohibitin superfamily)